MNAPQQGELKISLLLFFLYSCRGHQRGSDTNVFLTQLGLFMATKSWNSYHTYSYSAIVNQYKNGNPVRLFRTFRKDFTRTGVSNPHWKTQTYNGLNASTPMTVTIRDHSLAKPKSTVYYTVTEPPKWIPYRTYDESDGLLNWIDGNQVPGPFGPFNVVAENRARSQLYRQIRNAHHQFQGGVFVGEFRKTAGMIAGTAIKFRKGVIDYLIKGKRLRGNPKTPQKLLTDTYLENVFGWQPLINDVRDGAKALGRLIHENVEPIRFRSFGVAEGGTSSPPSVLAEGYQLFSTFTTLKSKVIYYGAFKGTVPNAARIEASLGGIVAMSGFDLNSFIPTIWELLPYSFLVDYFINVGECLEAMNTDTSNVKWITRVQRLESSIRDTFSYIGPSEIQRASFNAGEKSNPSFTGSGGSYVRNYIEINRAASEVPTMEPRFLLTGISGKQLLNTAALLTR